MSKPDLPALAAEIYKILEPHEPDVRERAIRAAIVMLGGNVHLAASGNRIASEISEEEHDGSPLPPKAKMWMRTHGIAREQLDQVFHLEGGSCEVLPSEAPGKNGKEKTINAYVLTGVAALLAAGEAKFDDKSARDVCGAMGCFNQGNHAYYLKGRGNLLGGTKDAGWTLTGPGLKLGAELTKSLLKEKVSR